MSEAEMVGDPAPDRGAKGPLQLRRRVGERLADELRDRILRGELTTDNGLLKQDELFEEYRVSMPSVREAMRTLETEGLITIRRGNRGGAEVHPPQLERAGYVFGLVLQGRSVSVHDLGLAVRRLDPMCAEMCATRPDRMETVVPALREIHQRTEASLGDFAKFVACMKEFHEALVRNCGNQTFELLVGMLEGLWYAHEEEWAARTVREGELPGTEATRRSIESHAELIRAIEQGDGPGAAILARRHQEDTQPQANLGVDPAVVVNAQLIRPPD
ncbi:FCD domain-containing protein [Dactylosporangium sp. NPDC000244]|uniref:FadR/GntR family transcriptional regulator n=1 Tax=Dactylosporangium sp. NPDC000244 TaxID=3154365 RepID=UPI00332FE195|nr:GntR family transcriptional regulator [Dactylosporangium thailandense]